MVPISVSGAMLPSSSCTTARISIVLTAVGLLQQPFDLGEKQRSGVAIAYPVVGGERGTDDGARQSRSRRRPRTMHDLAKADDGDLRRVDDAETCSTPRSPRLETVMVGSAISELRMRRRARVAQARASVVIKSSRDSRSAS